MTTATRTLLQVRINDRPHAIPAPAVLADALALAAAAPPFAAAVNRVFVPRSAYGTHTLGDGDRIEVIRPVTGG
ncbi:sulfur carrier protein ThiS [Variovorax sp. RHLX14]|uniref:sulfur carrier protein ThiS n=1 Tax=Variovorax sp. RHLX14 TaxID=1259731 RepID=UPI003F46D12E